MILLDTNVLSALMRREPDKAVAFWLDDQPRLSIWTTSISVMELRSGVQILPAGRKRLELDQALEILLAEKIADRVAPFDAVAARHAADLMAARHKKERPVELRDTMIAGIALAHHASIATRNTAHFEDLTVRVVNPWRA